MRGRDENLGDIDENLDELSPKMGEETNRIQESARCL